MTANINVKVKAGVRAGIEVAVCPTAVNEKTFVLPNGKQTTDRAIAEWIKAELTKALKQLAEVQ